VDVIANSSRLSLSSRILVGLGLGVFVGLFFGETAAALQPIADIYIRLMQMTVLPYLVMALVIGFGQLERETARRLALRGGRSCATCSAGIHPERHRDRGCPGQRVYRGRL
jgi:Na+/H+-dicarboxylate symporter